MLIAIFIHGGMIMEEIFILVCDLYPLMRRFVCTATRRTVTDPLDRSVYGQCNYSRKNKINNKCPPL